MRERFFAHFVKRGLVVEEALTIIFFERTLALLANE